MEILPLSTSNSTAVGNDVGVHLSSSVVKATCSYFKLKDIFKASIKELKKTMNIQDTLSDALNKQDFPQKTSSIRLQEDQVEDLYGSLNDTTLPVNTNIRSGSGLDSGFPSLVDTTGTIHTQDGAHGIHSHTCANEENMDDDTKVKLHSVPVTTFSEDGLSSIATILANVELKDTIVVAMPNIVAEDFYTCNIREECPNNIGSGEEKNLKKPSQNPRGVLFDLKGKPLEKVDSSGDYDSKDEVASVENEIACFLARNDGYGTNSPLEQWKDPYENADYDYDPYDDDMYEGQKIPKKFQSICGNLDIKVKGRKKK
ncbi:hypothetical protein Tco_0655151 [Tanacetum coccineum]|uniref:Uncharacterized protein n=1 Tax=Tanacetum coccineum TaxID=301880 RepID=A0ABQ4X5I4_9ASTR